MTTITPYLLYADCEAALDFLAGAFGFEEVLRFTGDDGRVNHAEARLGDANVFMGNPGAGYRGPREAGETAGFYVQIDGGLDGLCERARAAGAEIVEEPTDQDYGDRRFSARDPEGHRWYFAQRLREVAPEEWGAEAR